jgi:hypothetical protein
MRTLLHFEAAVTARGDRGDLNAGRRNAVTMLYRGGGVRRRFLLGVGCARCDC